MKFLGWCWPSPSSVTLPCSKPQTPLVTNYRMAEVTAWKNGSRQTNYNLQDQVMIRMS